MKIKIKLTQSNAFTQGIAVSTLAFLLVLASLAGYFGNELGTGRSFRTTLPISEPLIMHKSDQILTQAN
jgi:hypothetical protein